MDAAVSLPTMSRPCMIDSEFKTLEDFVLEDILCIIEQHKPLLSLDEAQLKFERA